MRTHPMLDPESTPRRVFEVWPNAAVVTQRELCRLTGRTQGSVCKALQLLIDEGYAVRVGKALNRHGRALGRPQKLFARTGKGLGTPEVCEPLRGADLADVMNAVVRRGLRRNGK